MRFHTESLAPEPKLKGGSIRTCAWTDNLSDNPDTGTMSSVSKGHHATGMLRKAWDSAVDLCMRKEVVGLDKNGNKYYR